VSPFRPVPTWNILATQGWRDGFEQIQLGKQETDPDDAPWGLPAGRFMVSRNWT